ncbi:MAG: Hsp20/alpha crystallin family protein [Pseudomonadota bacterium]
MPQLILWKNQEINRFKRDMDRLFERFIDEFSTPLSQWAFREVPFIDLSETEDHLILRAEIPGIRPEDLGILIKENVLTIHGEIKQDFATQGENSYRTESRYGSFSRKVLLPCRIMVEDVEATYKMGVLHIIMPKCKEDKAREIKIQIHK